MFHPWWLSLGAEFTTGEVPLPYVVPDKLLFRKSEQSFVQVLPVHVNNLPPDAFLHTTEFFSILTEPSLPSRT